ncbi:MAG: lipid-A-disaccharide synthase N-terminal domain-containing protein [Candidatus Latescibacterota bacterium]
MNHFWIILGFCGQFAFASRFLLQWIASERAGKSVVPTPFWIVSIIGSLVLLAYAVQRRDPVFILGQSTGIFIYSRNLALINGERRRNCQSA